MSFENIIEVNVDLRSRAKTDAAKSYRLRVNVALPCRKHYFFLLTLSRNSVQTKAKRMIAPAL